MSKELIDRLRGNPFAVRGADYLEAADAIESLTAERDRLREELAGLKRSLAASKTVIESKDKAYSLIQQRWDAMAAKAATVDSERECNGRLTAEIDRLSAELAGLRAQSVAAAMAVGQACIELSETKASLASAHAAFSRIVLMLVGVGAPLNDNVLGFNGEQRKYLHRILDVAEGRNEQPAPVPAAVPSIPVDDLIEMITEYGGYRENEGGSYATFQKFTARQYRSEADEVLAEIKAMLAAAQKGE